MIFALVSTIYSVGPIFSIPGITSSNLYSTITKPDNFPLCVNFTKERTQIWPIPNTPNTEENLKCIETLIDTTAFENNTIKIPDGVIIETDPIIKQEIPYFRYYDNVYYVSYNWVHYYVGINDTFETLKKKIESEVESNENHEKAFIAGYSLGGNFVRYFLTHYVDEEWKSKYIQAAMFFVAGVGGAFSSPTFVSTGIFMGGLKSDSFSRHMPSLYSMFPNFQANKKESIINGKSFGSSQIFEEMAKISEESKGEKLIFKEKGSGKESEVEVVIDDTCRNLYNIFKPYLEEEIKDPNVPSLIAYNSAIPVICGVNTTQLSSNEFEYEIYNCGGDVLMPSRGVEYAVENWKNVKYRNFNSTDRKYDHSGLGRTQELADMVKEFIEENSQKPSQDNKKLSKKTLIIICSCVGGAVLIVVVVIIIVVVKKRKHDKNGNFTKLT